MFHVFGFCLIFPDQPERLFVVFLNGGSTELPPAGHEAAYWFSRIMLSLKHCYTAGLRLFY
jgi:hypothetical protein